MHGRRLRRAGDDQGGAALPLPGLPQVGGDGFDPARPAPAAPAAARWRRARFRAAANAYGEKLDLARRQRQAVVAIAPVIDGVLSTTYRRLAGASGSTGDLFDRHRPLARHLAPEGVRRRRLRSGLTTGGAAQGPPPLRSRRPLMNCRA